MTARVTDAQLDEWEAVIEGPPHVTDLRMAARRLIAEGGA